MHGSAYVAHLAGAEAQSTVPACPRPAAATAGHWHSQAGIPARKRQSSSNLISKEQLMLLSGEQGMECSNISHENLLPGHVLVTLGK